MFMANQVLRALGHGDEIMRGFHVPAQPGAQHLRGHHLDFIGGVTDPPKHHLAVRSQADRRIRQALKLVPLVPFVDYLGEFPPMLFSFRRWQTSPFRMHFVKRKAHELAARLCAGWRGLGLRMRLFCGDSHMKVG